MVEAAGGSMASERTADLEEFFRSRRSRINAALERCLPGEDRVPQGLHQAMRYSVFAGGKRLRPLLLIASGNACEAATEALLPAACAFELVHTYSLIHDDLPAFDDEDFRRGKPTNHRCFGEAVAILAGDALQALAFETMAAAAAAAIDPTTWVAATRELAAAAGSIGMCGGQWLDLRASDDALDLEGLRALHTAKTGALLVASVRCGAILAAAPPEIVTALERYGHAIGLAFQVVDDILDVEGSLENLGKRPGGDSARSQPTFPSLIGIKGAHAEANRLLQRSLVALEPLGRRGDLLAQLATFIVHRDR